MYIEYRPMKVPIDENSTIQLILKENETAATVSSNITTKNMKNIETFADVISILNEWKNRIMN